MGQRPNISQPRAAPWVADEQRSSPERAQRNPAIACLALSGLFRLCASTQGAALGWHVLGRWPMRMKSAWQVAPGARLRLLVNPNRLQSFRAQLEHLQANRVRRAVVCA